MVIVNSCMIWFHFDCIMQLKNHIILLLMFVAEKMLLLLVISLTTQCVNGAIPQSTWPLVRLSTKFQKWSFGHRRPVSEWVCIYLCRTRPCWPDVKWRMRVSWKWHFNCVYMNQCPATKTWLRIPLKSIYNLVHSTNSTKLPIHTTSKCHVVANRNELVIE